MKYTKYIAFLLFINLIIVFLSIYIGTLTRQLEITNNLIQNKIINNKDQLKINKIEFSFYNNPDYLKKIHDIYFSLDEKKLETKIFSISSLSNKSENRFILIDLIQN